MVIKLVVVLLAVPIYPRLALADFPISIPSYSDQVSSYDWQSPYTSHPWWKDPNENKDFTMCPQFPPQTLCTDLGSKPFCGDDCSNTPYCLTTCWPTDAGPAWSGGGSSDSYQLYCPYATYANCHYSGPSYPTGTNEDNIALPCELNDSSTVANCKCEVATGETYVNLTAIINLGVYYETVAVCGEDGSLCLNMANCPNGHQGECQGQVAPVCKYVRNQNPNNDEVSLVPGADLISTFGFTMSNDYPAGSTSCENLFIAGCMTAPCYYTDDSKEYAQCECPIAFHQSVSLSQDNQECQISPGYVWE